MWLTRNFPVQSAATRRHTRMLKGLEAPFTPKSLSSIVAGGTLAARRKRTIKNALGQAINGALQEMSHRGPGVTFSLWALAGIIVASFSVYWT